MSAAETNIVVTMDSNKKQRQGDVHRAILTVLGFIFLAAIYFVELTAALGFALFGVSAVVLSAYGIWVNRAFPGPEPDRRPNELPREAVTGFITAIAIIGSLSAVWFLT